MQTFKIGIHCRDDNFLFKAQELAARLHFPLLEDEPLHHYDFILEVGSQVGLRLGADEKLSPLVVDYGSGAIDFRRRFGGKGGQSVLKAVGGAKKRILDCTAGLGRDAFILASEGCNVRALEKSPVVASLVFDALERARLDENLVGIINRLTYEVKDSLGALNELKPFEFDAIYIDPMFPAKTKAALPKKDLRILQMLLSHDNNNDEGQALLALAKEKCHRVVVKRPQSGKPLSDGVSVVFTGNSTRFDVYLS